MKKNILLLLSTIGMLMTGCGSTTSSSSTVTSIPSSSSSSSETSSIIPSSTSEIESSSESSIESSFVSSSDEESSIEPSSSEHVHIASRYEKENIVPAGCDYPGSYDYIAYCECGEIVSTTHEVIEELGHYYILTRIEEASYESPGYKYYECQRCKDQTYSKFEEQLEHTYSTEWSIDDNLGTHYHACLDDGYFDLRKDEEPHSFSTWKTVIEPGETTSGKQERSCICGLKEERLINSIKEEECLEYCTFTEYDDHCVLTGITNSPEELYIPSLYNDLPVTKIEGSVMLIKGMKKLHISDTVITLDSNAFSYCPDLEEVYLGNRLTRMEDRSFYWCDKLHTVRFPNSLVAIRDLSFYGCRNIKNYYFDGTPSQWADIDMGNSVTGGFDGYKLFFIDEDGEYQYKDSKYSLPSKIVVEDINILHHYSFAYLDQIEEVNISEGVVSIGEGAFAGCKNLSKVTLPDESLEIVSASVFAGCKALKNLTLPDTITYLGSSVFSFSGITSLSVPKLINSVPYGYAQGCYDLVEVNLHEGIETIGDYAFYECLSLPSITLPSSLSSIGNGSFYECESMESITLPENVTSVGDYAFMEMKSLKSVTMNDKLESIGVSAFSECISLRSVTVPQSVTTIGSFAFNSCNNITSMTLSDNLVDVGDDVFYGCTSLSQIYTSKLDEYKTSFGTSFDLFNELNQPLIEGTLIEDGKYTYIDDGVDKILVGYYGDEPILVIPDYITKIKNYALYNHRIVSIVLPNDAVVMGNKCLPKSSLVESIISGSPSKVNKEGDFYYYEEDGKYHLSYYAGNDSEVIIPDIINVIDTDAFTNRFKTYNNAITSIVFGSGVKEVQSDGINAMYLSHIELNDGLETLRNSSINSYALHDISFPETLTTLEEAAINISINGYLNEFITPLGITELYRIASHDANVIHRVVVTDNIKILHQYALASYVDEVIIGKGVTKIEAYALSSSNFYRSITYLGTMEEFNAIDLDETGNNLSLVHCSDGDIVFESL